MSQQIKENIPIKNIQIGLHASSWDEAIQLAAEPLVQAGSIKSSYVDAMIQSVCDLGPYIALMPGFALAHSAPSDDVVRTDISIAVFETPITFRSENDPIYVVMCLACRDKASHIMHLQNIAQKFLGTPDFVGQIRMCADKNELGLLINGSCMTC